MVTANHREVVPDYLSDLAQAVQTVRENPDLARSGGAATYGMMAHVPLRGMVRTKVLDIFAQMYSAGGGGLDLSKPAAPNLSERLMGKYVHWRASRR
jgi:hypothetical protein